MDPSLGAGIVYRTASVPPSAAAALQHIPRGWRVQGKVMAGTEHPLLQRWECGINDSDRSNCTTAQKQKKGQKSCLLLLNNLIIILSGELIPREQPLSAPVAHEPFWDL